MSLPLLVSPAQLAEQLDRDPGQIVIIDLSSAENYATKHLPGARHMAPAGLLCGEQPIPNKRPSDAQFSALLASLGITPDSHVVVYDDQMGPQAGRMIWTLHAAGHSACSFLDGHLKAWEDAGFATTAEVPHYEPTEYPASLDTHNLADMEYILTHLNNPEHCILDVRSPAEYRGEKVVNAAKGGHIPGAVNYNWTNALISEQDTRLRPAADILEELAALGVTPDKTVITHCQTHRRSGLSYLFTKHLGFENVRCYDGSWFEWGNHPSTPVEQ
ncbi:sulfurtransferase [Aliamphritea spongicola]|uniref:sulfurtransferase n=1 Tax=Aliamphritea spongicola TaxID=707589 RepID=UPI00196AA215|nr:sulfurtransferase [Aliamphritea spongicola]MBN3563955.1 sulfurtransferase [Aliamphritea spongicola]